MQTGSDGGMLLKSSQEMTTKVQIGPLLLKDPCADLEKMSVDEWDLDWSYYHYYLQRTRKRLHDDNVLLLYLLLMMLKVVKIPVRLNDDFP